MPPGTLKGRWEPGLCVRSARQAHPITRRAARITSANAASNSVPPGLRVSERVTQTDEPVIVKTKKLMAAADTPPLSLAQGVVHWDPPVQSVDAASLALDKSHSYGPAAGLPELVAALEAKIASENSLSGYRVMVTAGANQAFVNIVLSLLDSWDRVILFSPYYFNHRMAIQMAGGANSIVYGPCHPHNFHPDLDWLERELKQPVPPKMVVLINPCNPTGTLMSRPELERASELCRKHGAWLVMDNTYEYFTYDGRRHCCVSAPHVLHIFSFSKAFGMAGWRVGYIAYPEAGGPGALDLGSELTKVQDTIPICPPQLSQHMALAATLRAGRPWVQQQLGSIQANRDWLIDALSPLGRPGKGIAGGEGAIYLWAKLPAGANDEEWVQRLISEHGVCVIPGSACGAPGHIRIAYANLKPSVCAEAAVRLNKGLQQLVPQQPYLQPIFA